MFLLIKFGVAFEKKRVLKRKEKLLDKYLKADIEGMV